MNISSVSSSTSMLSLESVRRSQSLSPAEAMGIEPAAQSQLSKLGNYMKQLQKLQESDPDKFKEVTAKISGLLQEEATRAEESGNTKQAEALRELAAKFETASVDGTMPDLRPPGHRGGPQGPPPGPPPEATDAAGSAASTDSTDALATAVAERYSAIIAMLGQEADSNPMSVLTNVLDSVLD